MSESQTRDKPMSFTDLRERRATVRVPRGPLDSGERAEEIHPYPVVYTRSPAVKAGLERMRRESTLG